MKYTTAIAALLSVSAQTTTTTTKPERGNAEVVYANTLKCGQCVKGGYNFCFQGTDGDVVAAANAAPTSTCCEDGTCTEASNTAYSCSAAYSDVEYALSFCPQKQAKCGDKQEVTFDEVNEEENITITGLTEGETCSYTIKSKKGSPAFKMSDASADDTKVNVTYVEYAKSKSKATTTAAKGTDKSPKEGLPVRDQTFEDSGEQGKKTGQSKPARKKADGTETSEEGVTKEKEYIKKKKANDEEEKKEKEEKEGEGFFKKAFGKEDEEEKTDAEKGEKTKPAAGETEADTTATEGYGAPTKGTYSATSKGYKTFGTVGQGDNKEGVKESADKVEAERGMIVSVTAVADQGTDTILLETGNYDFLEEYVFTEETSATGLRAAFAAVALVGAAMF